MSYKFEHNKKTIELPDFKNMPAGVLRKARKFEADEQMWFILEEVLDAKTLALVDELSISEFTDMMNGWTQGAPLGESLQSSKS